MYQQGCVVHSYLVHFAYNAKVIFFPTMCNTTAIRFGEQGWRSGESARLPPVWPGFNSRRRRICGLSLLLVLSLAPRHFSPGTPVFLSPQKPTLPNSNSIWNARTRLNEFLWTPMCFVGEQAISIFFFVKSEIIKVSVMVISFGLRPGTLSLISQKPHPLMC